MNSTRLCLTGLLLIAVSACGAAKEEETAVPEGPAAAFHGVWKGDYKKLDAEGLKLKQTGTKAEFVAEDETSGTFEFLFPEEDNSVTKGKFQVFNRTKLILEIESSNYSGIGLTGTISSLGFELSSSVMEITDDDLEIVLVRDKDGTLNSDGDVDATVAKSIQGRWRCVDKASNSWDMSIDDQKFNVSVAGSGSSYFIMNGTLNSVNEHFSQASLLIEHASNGYETYVGRSLNVNRTDKGLDVIMTSDDRQLDQFTCDKK